MVLENCKIHFANDAQVFNSGDIVSGTIKFVLYEEKKLTDLSFNVIGESVCMWSEEEEDMDTGKEMESVDYHAREVHFSTGMSLLLGCQKCDGLVTLPPGQHTFSFRFPLPRDSPTSQEGLYGRTRYTVRIEALIPAQGVEHFIQPFTVIARHDLNSNTSCCSRSVTKEIIKDCNLTYINRGDISLTINLPYTGFVPGQTALMNCKLVNPSTDSITQIKFTLIQVKTYMATSPKTRTKTENTKILIYFGRGADGGESLSYPVDFQIPSLPPTSQRTSTLIQTKYFIKVSLILSGVQKNIKDVIPITIGTVPLYKVERYYTSVLASAAPSTSQTNLQHGSIKGNKLNTHRRGLAPPSYKECRWSNAMLQKSGETIEDFFSPLYPVYTFPPLDWVEDTTHDT